jgi:hypothetical protein
LLPIYDFSVLAETADADVHRTTFKSSTDIE